jgi:hypothetical protein
MKAKLAERLITGLAGEYQRWTATIKKLTVAEGEFSRCQLMGRHVPLRRRIACMRHYAQRKDRKHAGRYQLAQLNTAKAS